MKIITNQRLTKLFTHENIEAPFLIISVTAADTEEKAIEEVINLRKLMKMQIIYGFLIMNH